MKDFFDLNITRKDEMVKDHLVKQPVGSSVPLFSIVEFNLCGLCNRRCVFCPRVNPELFPNVDKGISVELYEKVMKDLRKVNFDGTIIYSAFSEPLLYKDIEILIGLSRRYCPEARLEIVTNGDFVTSEKLSRLFKAGLTTLCISMYDGPHQLAHFRALQKKAGLRDDQIVFRQRWLPPEEHFGITLSNRAGALEIKEIGIAPLKEPLKKPCYYPFYQIFINYDGTVLLCAHDWNKRLIVGNLNEQSILEVWDNDILKQVRVNLSKADRNFHPCDLCDAKGVLIGRNHFKKWSEYYESQQPVKK
ncbi:MAG: Radical SAM superfamily enzyme [Parcubacteria group bacterium GW2011_GWA2_47_10b]|nr:MAG: Radical SAM superfamily enzyme [Parcubacteria group bacterium GW2011_GWA2_47_10b]